MIITGNGDKPLRRKALLYWRKREINDISGTFLARFLLFGPSHLSDINGNPGHGAPTQPVLRKRRFVASLEGDFHRNVRNSLF